MHKLAMPVLQFAIGGCIALFGAFCFYFCWAFTIIPTTAPDYYSRKLSIMLDPADQLWSTITTIVIFALGVGVTVLGLVRFVRTK